MRCITSKFFAFQEHVGNELSNEVKALNFILNSNFVSKSSKLASLKNIQVINFMSYLHIHVANFKLIVLTVNNRLFLTQLQIIM